MQKKPKYGKIIPRVRYGIGLRRRKKANYLGSFRESTKLLIGKLD